MWTIDTFGRRALLLFTFPNMFWTLLGKLSAQMKYQKSILTVTVAGLCFLIDHGLEHSSGRIAAVATFIYLFDAFYSPGQFSQT